MLKQPDSADRLSYLPFVLTPFFDFIPRSLHTPTPPALLKIKPLPDPFSAQCGSFRTAGRYRIFCLEIFDRAFSRRRFEFSPYGGMFSSKDLPIASHSSSHRACHGRGLLGENSSFSIAKCFPNSFSGQSCASIATWSSPPSPKFLHLAGMNLSFPRRWLSSSSPPFVAARPWACTSSLSVGDPVH